MASTTSPSRAGGPPIVIRLVTVALAALLGAALGGVPGYAATNGYVRLAHLSPDTPAVDVYLTAVSGNPAPQTFPAVGYGVMSDYLTLPSGAYTVAMRTAGAPATSPPVLSTDVTVRAGRAYTVAGVGRYADLGLKVIEDDLTAPPPGKARLRAIHASVRVPNLDLTVVDGPTLIESARFASTSPYREAPAGPWQLRVQPKPDGEPATVEVNLEAGAVYSLLILDGKGGKLTVEPRLDAKGTPVMPVGPIAAGAGGTSDTDQAPVGWLVVAALLIVGTLVPMLLRRRIRPRSDAAVRS